MPWALAGAAIGAVGSMSAADAQAEAAGKAKDPWSGAEPWIRDNIATGQQLQAHYQQNPFNSIQQQGMQGQLDNYAHQNNVVIPGLLGFSQGLMGQSYQRAPQRPSFGLMNSAPSVNQPSLQWNATQQPLQISGAAPGGNPGGAGYMAAPTGNASRAPVDFNAQNPLYKPPVTEQPAAAAPDPMSDGYIEQLGKAMFPERWGKTDSGFKTPQDQFRYLMSGMQDGGMGG